MGKFELLTSREKEEERHQVRKTISILLVLAVAATMSFVGITSASAQLADATWHMFHHDVQHTGRRPYIGSDTPDLRWTFPAEGPVNLSPAI